MTLDPRLQKHGLFDAKVPRYTSYPPATRFAPGQGQRVQRDWMTQLTPGEPVSIYIHIPFCRRLCWFCACRTQGTQTLKPVDAYIDTLLDEIRAARALMPEDIPMARLHLGGGTPTILSAELMDRLLQAVFEAFAPAPGFEFSVEIDPTDAAPELLATLAKWGMDRASIGVQDFEPEVQKAIGRPQGFDLTKTIVTQLRDLGIGSLNVDLLYGLPQQTYQSLMKTLEQTLTFRPDRIALFGYAHVPNMSKRQVLIASDDLPSVKSRFHLQMMARDRLVEEGYDVIGIDHFALPEDSMAKAARTGTLRRNFQGYTDDPCPTLIGFGASAISKYREGFVQNAVATGAYRQRIEDSAFAGDKGYVLTEEDHVVSAMVQDLMCSGGIDLAAVRAAWPAHDPLISQETDMLLTRFPDVVLAEGDRLEIDDAARELTRIVAAALDVPNDTGQKFSLAV